MAHTVYYPGVLPQEYDQQFWQEELNRLAAAINELAVSNIVLIPQAEEPFRKDEGMVTNADGTNWNPGGGAGLYQYLSGAWVKL